MRRLGSLGTDRRRHIEPLKAILPKTIGSAAGTSAVYAADASLHARGIDVPKSVISSAQGAFQLWLD
jgi:hypothetical protein